MSRHRVRSLITRALLASFVFQPASAQQQPPCRQTPAPCTAPSFLPNGDNRRHIDCSDPTCTGPTGCGDGITQPWKSLPAAVNAINASPNRNNIDLRFASNPTGTPTPVVCEFNGDDAVMRNYTNVAFEGNRSTLRPRNANGGTAIKIAGGSKIALRNLNVRHNGAFVFDRAVLIGELSAPAPGTSPSPAMVPISDITVEQVDVGVLDTQCQAMGTRSSAFVLGEAPMGSNGVCFVNTDAKCAGSGEPTAIERLKSHGYEIATTSSAGSDIINVQFRSALARHNFGDGFSVTATEPGVGCVWFLRKATAEANQGHGFSLGSNAAGMPVLLDVKATGHPKGTGVRLRSSAQIENTIIAQNLHGVYAQRGRVWILSSTIGLNDDSPQIGGVESVNPVASRATFSIFNTIAAGNGSSVSSPLPLTCGHNLFSGAASGCAGDSIDVASLNLSSTYHAQTDLIKRGVNPSALTASLGGGNALRAHLTDFEDNPRPAHGSGNCYNIGAFQDRSSPPCNVNTPTVTPTRPTATPTLSPAPSNTRTISPTRTFTPATPASATPTLILTSSPTRTFTDTPTRTPTLPPFCAGDCDADDEVSIDEIIVLVSTALGLTQLSECPAGDLNGDGQITVDEILVAVINALGECTIGPPLPQGGGGAAPTPVAVKLGWGVAGPGETTTIPVMLETGSNSVAALQLDILFDAAAIESVLDPQGKPSCVLDPRLSGTFRLEASLPPGTSGRLRLIVLQDDLLGAVPTADSGVVARCEFKVKPGATTGVGYILQLDRIVTPNPDGLRLPVVGNWSSITVLTPRLEVRTDVTAVGAGLQEGGYYVTASSDVSEPLSIIVGSATPDDCLVSLSATTEGDISASLPAITSGNTSAPFYVQAMEDTRGTCVIDAVAPDSAYARGRGWISIVQPAIGLDRLPPTPAFPATISSMAANVPMVLHAGIVSGSDTSKVARLQALRAGGEGVSVEVDLISNTQTPTPPGQLRYHPTPPPPAQSVEVPIPAAWSYNPTPGLQFDPLSMGSTVLRAIVDGWITTDSANRTIEVDDGPTPTPNPTCGLGM